MIHSTRNQSKDTLESQKAKKSVLMLMQDENKTWLSNV